MDFDLSEEQRMAIDSLRRFAEAEIAPVAEEYRDRLIPKPMMHELLAKLAPFGVGCGRLPAAYGGMDLDTLTSGLLSEELARISVDIAATAFIQESVALAIARHGNDEQKARWLARMCSGELIGCAGITEPDTGSNVQELRTRARREGEDFRIEGEKTWISNGGIADICIAVCRTGPGRKGLSRIVIERGPGFTSRELPKLGVNSWSTAQLTFEDMLVPAANLIGEEGSALSDSLRSFETARCYVGLLALGVARAAFERAVAYAGQRRQWGKLIAGHQMVQNLIAEMATELECAQLLCYRGLAAVDKGQRCDTQTSMAKYFATEAAQRITSKAIQVHGAYGLSRELPMELHFRDARMFSIPDGTSEIQKLIIGRNILGVSAFGEPDTGKPAEGRAPPA